MEQLVGLAGVSLIRELVEITAKDRSGIVKVLASLVFGVVLNIALSFALGTDFITAVSVGLVAGFVSNLYNDARK